MLTKDAKIDAKDSHGRTPLHWATMKGHNLVLETLLQNGSNIEAQINSTGSRPLHLAIDCTMSNARTLKTLLNNGADIEAKNNFGARPIHFAVVNEDDKSAEILIQNGAQLDVREGLGLAPIHLASIYRKSSIFQMLVRSGASLKIRTDEGLTPLEFDLKMNKNDLKHKKAVFYSGMM